MKLLIRRAATSAAVLCSPVHRLSLCYKLLIVLAASIVELTHDGLVVVVATKSETQNFRDMREKGSE